MATRLGATVRRGSRGETMGADIRRGNIQGYAAPFEIPRFDEGRGGGRFDLRGISGFLKKMQRMKERLAEEQLRSMTQGRQQSRRAELAAKHQRRLGQKTQAEQLLQAKKSRRGHYVYGERPGLGLPQALAGQAPLFWQNALTKNARMPFAPESGGFARPGAGLSPSELTEAGPSLYERNVARTRAQRYGTPSLRRGTLPGTVPSTGKRMLHKGEVVIPPEQVDKELVAVLSLDARRKGVPLGKEFRKGYQTGSLKERFRGPFFGGPIGEGPGLQDVTVDDLKTLLGLLTAPVGGLSGVPKGKVSPQGAPPQPSIVQPRSGVTEPVFPEEEVKREFAPDLEGALSRLQTLPRGEEQTTRFGTSRARIGGDEPITLTGELSEREKAFKDVAGLPAQREDKYQAGRAQNRAEEIYLDLLQRGDRIRPDVQKAMQAEADRLLKSADKIDKRVEGREKAVEKDLGAGAALAAAIAKINAQQGAIGQRQIGVAESKVESQKNRVLLSGATDTLRQLRLRAVTAKHKSERSRAQLAIADLLQEIRQLSTGKAFNADESFAIAEEMLALPDAEFEEAMERLQERINKAT